MGKTRNAKNAQRARNELTVSHRERVINELRADSKLAAEYLAAAAEDDDARVYLVASRTVAGRQP